MPSVVNISTTQTVITNTNPFPFQFPPGSPFEDMFKEFGAPQERKSSALGGEKEKYNSLSWKSTKTKRTIANLRFI